MIAAWGHDALAADLAAHLRGMSRPMLCWLDMQLGPSGSPRPDVYCLEPTYQRLVAQAFEVKVTIFDFRRDAQSGKALGYRKFAGALSFAAPAGLIPKAELPDGCGLIERGPERWRWAKKPTVNPIENLPRAVWMKLVIDGVKREQSAALAARKSLASLYTQDRIVARVLGEEIGRLYRNRETAKLLLQNEASKLDEQRHELTRQRRAHEEAVTERIRAERDSLHAEISRVCEELGIEHSRDAWSIRQRLAELRPDHDARALAEAERELRASIHRLQIQADKLGARLGRPVEEAPHG